MDQIKTFEDLNKEIINSDNCVQCNGCVFVCLNTKLCALEIRDNRPQFVLDSEDIQKCLDCGICYKICPVIKDLKPKIDELFVHDPIIGNIKNIIWAKSADNTILNTCHGGGIVTALLKFLFDTKRIDCAIVGFPFSSTTHTLKIITSMEELLPSVKKTPVKKVVNCNACYCEEMEKCSIVDNKPVGYCCENCIYKQILKAYKNQIPCSRAELIPVEQEIKTVYELESISDFYDKKIAFVGKSCEVETIKRMQFLKIRPVPNIKYIIGLFHMFCVLGERNFENNADSYCTGCFKATNGCKLCSDLTNVYSDISIGVFDELKDYSTILIRNETGSQLYFDAVLANYLSEYKNPKAKIGEMKVKFLSRIKALAKFKYEKAKIHLSKSKF
ncbi:MAG: Coenzyme F420 hydrogenase/dehydrogenase, beta subunit C-terminal domain [Candidatus Helarchaeota archaeon]